MGCGKTTTNCCRKKTKLRLHITRSVLLLFGSRSETNEYARYANCGNFDEQSHCPSCVDCRPDFHQHRVWSCPKLLLRKRSQVWIVHPPRAALSTGCRLAGPGCTCLWRAQLRTSRSRLGTGRLWNLQFRSLRKRRDTIRNGSLRLWRRRERSHPRGIGLRRQLAAAKQLWCRLSLWIRRRIQA